MDKEVKKEVVDHFRTYDDCLPVAYRWAKALREVRHFYARLIARRAVRQDTPAASWVRGFECCDELIRHIYS